MLDRSLRKPSVSRWALAARRTVGRGIEQHRRKVRQCPVCNIPHYLFNAPFPRRCWRVSNNGWAGREWPRLCRAMGMGVGATLLGRGSFPISRWIAFQPVTFQSVIFRQVTFNFKRCRRVPPQKPSLAHFNS